MRSATLTVGDIDPMPLSGISTGWNADEIAFTPVDVLHLRLGQAAYVLRVRDERGEVEFHFSGKVVDIGRSMYGNVQVSVKRLNDVRVVQVVQASTESVP